MGNLRRLYQEASCGDYLLVPGNGLFAEVLIGKFIDDPSLDNTLVVDIYPRSPIPYRQVEWLSFPYRTSLSRPLSESLSRPLAITNIVDAALQAEILQLAHGNYVFNETAKQYFSGEQYDDKPYAPVPGLTLISALLCSVNAVLSGQSDIIENLSIDELADHPLSGNDVENFEINFASPGGYRVWAQRAVLALALSALVAATGANISYAEAIEAQVVNSKSDSDDDCNLPVQDTYRAVMEQLGLDRYNELCQLNERSKRAVGLKSGAKIIQTPRSGRNGVSKSSSIDK